MKQTKPNVWDIVIVYWVDSSGVGSWTDAHTVYEDEHISKCWTAGFYFGESKECVRIVSSASANESVDHIMYIPKVCIKRVELVKRGKR